MDRNRTKHNLRHEGQDGCLIRALVGPISVGPEGRRNLDDLLSRSADEVGSNDIKEFSRRDDLRVLPELRKVPLIAGNQVIGTGSVGTFHENVIGWIRGDQGQTRRRNDVGVILNQLDQLLTEAPADLQLGPSQNGRIFRQNAV